MTWQETEAHIRSLPKEEQMEAIFKARDSIGTLSKEEATNTLLSLLDILYDDLTGEAIQTYFGNQASNEAYETSQTLDAQYMSGCMKERGLLWTEKEGDKHVTKGTLYERIEIMVKNQEG